MQCFKLVNAGHVDRVIAFDELPKHLTQNVRTRDTAGFPRTWARWLASIGSTRTVFHSEDIMQPDRSYVFKKTPMGDEPCFFILDYLDINSDKDSWRAICDYLRMHVGSEVRLRENVVDMAMPFAGSTTDPLAIEPEDVPIIQVPKVEAQKPEIVQADEQIIIPDAPLKKKAGRPKKEAVA